MAWNWNAAPIGKISGTDSTSTPESKKKQNVSGISANAILNTPEVTVETVNIILGIGGKAIIVDKELNYNQDNEVINNG